MPDVPVTPPGSDPALAAALADRYTIERVLGRGGMATVYLARDLRHDRPVALKVLHPELAASLGTERFEREVKLAARLQHPHILTVHDSGEHAGRLWFTMPFVEGESLRTWLARERQLPVKDALRIAREAAAALAYAHRHGVIHRDIKPENILLTVEGDTLVADFGIARALGAGEDERLTETGLAIGTPAYMSPEQASGERSIDARSDIYSLGAVLYEMLAGEPPFTGPTAQAILARRFTESPRPIRQTRETVPEPVERAVATALARAPADRFATAGDFALALEAAGDAGGGTGPGVSTPSRAYAAPPGTAATVRTPTTASAAGFGGRRTLLVAGIAFLLGLGVLFAWRHGHPGADADGGAAAPGPSVIAVLPFESLGDSAQAYVADGIANELRGKLSQLGSLEVIARGSSMSYQHTSKSEQQIARELGAQYLLTATVEWQPGASGAKAARRLRVTPELVEVRAGHAPTTRWQQPFDATLTDVFQVQADIATKVATALGLALGDSARRQLAARPTTNLAAYDAFLKGEAVSASMSVIDPPTLRRAIGDYEQAVALDSTFLPAWVQLARARARLYSNTAPTPELAAAARAAVERARALGPDRPGTYLALGRYVIAVDYDNARGLAAFEEGLRLAPHDAQLLTEAAGAEALLGRWDAALQHKAEAARLDPRSAGAAGGYADLLIRVRRYPEAEAALARYAALAPTDPGMIFEGVLLALARGDLAGAQARVRTGLAAGIDSTALFTFLANYQDLYWVLDQGQQQRTLALPPAAFDNDRAVWAIVRAELYQLRGDSTRMRAWADTARAALVGQLAATPGDGQRRVFLGLMLAYLGRKTEAVQEGERAMALQPSSRDAHLGTYIQHQVVRIHVALGEPEQALNQLEPLLKRPYYLSPGWLRVDPTFAPLRGNPRFERLAAGK